MTAQSERKTFARTMWVSAVVPIFGILGMVSFLKTDPLKSFITFLIGVLLGVLISITGEHTK